MILHEDPDAYGRVSPTLAQHGVTLAWALPGTLGKVLGISDGELFMEVAQILDILVLKHVAAMRAHVHCRAEALNRHTINRSLSLQGIG